MRYVIMFLVAIGYLFSLVFMESELIKYQLRREQLRNRFQELALRQQELDSQLMKLSNLAVIETQARERNFVFPGKGDVLGIIR